jgi:hypothetical protein
MGLAITVSLGPTRAADAAPPPNRDTTAIAAIANVWGVSEEEVLRQEDLRDSVNDAVVAINTDPDNYAGVWFERGQTFRMHIMVNKDAASARNLIPDNIPVTYDTARYSGTELEAIRSKIDTQWAQETNTGLDVKMNKVTVEFHRTDTTNMEEI